MNEDRSISNGGVSFPGELPPGTIFENRLQICELLGSGGSSCVYKARHLQLDRYVALKISLAHSDDSLKRRVAREARALSQLEHRNVVRLLSYDTAADGRFYLVMEFVDGENLAAVLQAGSLPTARIVEIARQVCLGLIDAHAGGLVHRDLKPSNLMITSEGGVSFSNITLVKIVDFGIVLLQSKDTLDLTQGGIVGTPAYMSPEQFRGVEVDARSDIYSLGCVLYECATGKPLVPAGILPPSVTQPSVKSSRLRIEAPIPDSLRAIILKCLETEPEKRFQSMSELLGCLDSIKESEDRNTAGFRTRLMVPVALAGLLLLIIPFFTERKPTPSESRANSTSEYCSAGRLLRSPEKIQEQNRIRYYTSWLGKNETIGRNVDLIVLAHRWLAISFPLDTRMRQLHNRAALDRYEQLVADYKSGRLSGTWQIDRCLGDLAGAAEEMREFKQAEKMRRLEVEVIEKQYPARHVRRGAAKASLAANLKGQNRPAEAVPLYEEALNVVSPDPSWVYMTRRGYAAALAQCHRTDAANKQAEMCLQLIRASKLSGLEEATADLFCIIENYDRATDMYKEAAMLKQTCWERAVDYAAAVKCLNLADRVGEAEKLLKQIDLANLKDDRQIVSVVASLVDAAACTNSESELNQIAALMASLSSRPAFTTTKMYCWLRILDIYTSRGFELPPSYHQRALECLKKDTRSSPPDCNTLGLAMVLANFGELSTAFNVYQTMKGSLDSNETRTAGARLLLECLRLKQKQPEYLQEKKSEFLLQVDEAIRLVLKNDSAYSASTTLLCTAALLTGKCGDYRASLAYCQRAFSLCSHLDDMTALVQLHALGATILALPEQCDRPDVLRTIGALARKVLNRYDQVARRVSVLPVSPVSMLILRAETDGVEGHLSLADKEYDKAKMLLREEGAKSAPALFKLLNRQINDLERLNGSQNRILALSTELEQARSDYLRRKRLRK